MQAHATNSPRRAGRRAASPPPSGGAAAGAKLETTPPIAFGSRRPQRPSYVARMPTTHPATLGRHGSVRGIF